MGPSAQGPDGLLGQVIAGYRLERVLGVGATGAVFFATRVAGEQAEPPSTGGESASPAAAPPLPATAAIKLLFVPWQLSTEQAEEFRRRFLREAETLAQLHHPHLLSVLASGQDAATGHLYMVMPHISSTLAAHLTDAGGAVPLPLNEAAGILDQLAGALDYAHSQGVIHRDIKPANILRDEQGQVYLADFGILRLLDESRTQLTTTGGVLGTPEYMAPEQARGEAVGPAADRYSLAVVLYQMVTAHLPFEGGTAASVIVRQMQEPPPIPRSYRADLPEPAEAALLKALAKRPQDRFPLSSQFSEAFAAGLAGILSPLVTPTGPQQAQTLSDGGMLETPASPPAPTPLPWTPFPEAPALAEVAAGMGASARGKRRSQALWITLSAAIVLLLTAAVLAALIRPDLIQEALGGGAPTSTATQGQVVTNQASATDTTGAIASPFVGPTPTSTTAQATAVSFATATAIPTATDTPAPSHDIFTQFTIPYSGAGPDGITAGPDGNMWYVDTGTNSIGVITMSGAITEYPLPTPNAKPYQIAAGPDGNLWFTEINVDKIGRITTSGSISEFNVPTANAYPGGITAGSDGNVWFTEGGGANKVGRITPGGSITEYPYSGGDSPGITLGANGAVWVSGMWTTQIDEVTSGGSVTPFSLPSGNPLGITAGPDGNIWYADYYANSIGKLTPYGATQLYSIPSPSSYPTRITSGPNASLWFTESIGGRLGQISTSGAVTEYSPPNGMSPASIAFGPDGNLWITSGSPGSIVRFVP